MWEDLGLTQLTFMMTSVQLQVAERSVFQQQSESTDFSSSGIP